MDCAYPLFYYACETGDLDTVLHYIDRGEDVNSTRNDWCLTPLHAACKGAQSSVVALLICAGANVNAHFASGVTPLHVAMDADCMRLLLDAGADIHARDWEGKTPLHVACKFNDAECMRLLLEAGANVNAVSEYDGTPLHISAFRRNVDCMRLLLEFGADVSAVDDDGYTPLHLVCCVWNEDVERAVHVLVSAGANVHAVDKWQQTPVMLLHGMFTNTFCAMLSVGAFVDTCMRAKHCDFLW